MIEFGMTNPPSPDCYSQTPWPAAGCRIDRNTAHRLNYTSGKSGTEFPRLARAHMIPLALAGEAANRIDHTT